MVREPFVDFIKKSPFQHLSLHFGGVMVDKDRCQRNMDFGKEAAAAIEEATGFRVDLVQKVQQTLLQGLRSFASLVTEVEDPSGAMNTIIEMDLIIPLALADTCSNYGAVLGICMENRSTTSKTYRRWLEFHSGVLTNGDLIWLPRFGLIIPDSGPFVLHTDGEGRPTCIAFTRTAGGNLNVFVGKEMWEVKASDLFHVQLGCTDASTIVTFAPEASQLRPNDLRWELYQLRC